jgi:hypothetical protein
MCESAFRCTTAINSYSVNTVKEIDKKRAFMMSLLRIYSLGERKGVSTSWILFYFGRLRD